MTDIPTPQRGDTVTALPYYQDGEITGAYRPRDDYPDAEPPADAAWVDTGDPQGPVMVQADSVRTVGENESIRPDLREIRDRAQALADQVRTALAGDLTGVARVQLPLIPRLQLPSFFAPHAEENDPEPDKRHLVVQVRTVPVLGETSETHVYRDDRGLTWQTYGQEHDFSTDRLLEVVNEDADVVATYPPGTWLHVRYVAYLDETGNEAS